MKKLKTNFLIAATIFSGLFLRSLLFERFFNTNVRPLSSVDFMLRIAVIAASFFLLVVSIPAAVAFKKQKSKRGLISALIIFVVMIVFLSKTFPLLLDVKPFLLNETVTYRGYVDNNSKVRQRIIYDVDLFTGLLNEATEIEVTKSGKIYMDNYEVVKLRQNSTWGKYSGAAEVEYLPNSHFLINFDILPSSYLQKQVQKLDDVGEKVNIPMGTLDIYEAYHECVYTCKCDVEITNIVKHSKMEEFYGCNDIDSNYIAPYEIAVKLKLTYRDFESNDEGQSIVFFINDLKKILYQGEISKDTELFSSTDEDFNGSLNRVISKIPVSVHPTSDTEYVVEGWTIISPYYIDDKESPIYLVINEWGDDLNKDYAAVEIGDYFFK